jgi:hypothetical protein
MLIYTAVWLNLCSSSCNAVNNLNYMCFSGHYLRNRSTSDIGVLGYIGVL